MLRPYDDIVIGYGTLDLFPDPVPFTWPAGEEPTQHGLAGHERPAPTRSPSPCRYRPSSSVDHETAPGHASAGALLRLINRRRGTSPCAAVLDLIDTRVAEITAAIADLRTLRRTLIHARDAGDCPCPTEQVCAIEHPRDTPTSPGPDSPPPTHTSEDGSRK